MQCTSAYPTPLDAVGLNVIDELRREFDCPVGLSDHSGSMFPGLAALARGANLLEVHVTFDRRMFSPDIGRFAHLRRAEAGVPDARRAEYNGRPSRGQGCYG